MFLTIGIDEFNKSLRRFHEWQAALSYEMFSNIRRYAHLIFTAAEHLFTTNASRVLCYFMRTTVSLFLLSSVCVPLFLASSFLKYENLVVRRAT